MLEAVYPDDPDHTRNTWEVLIAAALDRDLPTAEDVRGIIPLDQPHDAAKGDVPVVPRDKPTTDQDDDGCRAISSKGNGN
jgi:hypothetical protein